MSDSEFSKMLREFFKTPQGKKHLRRFKKASDEYEKAKARRTGRVISLRDL